MAGPMEPQPWHAVAVIVTTRWYPRAEIISALVDAGFLASERPYGPDAIRLVEQVRPQLLILPLATDDDAGVVIELASRTPGHVVALVQEITPERFAELLEAGADVVLREGDGPAAFSAQVRALLRRWDAEAERGTTERRFAVQDLVIDLDRHTVMRAGQLIPLPPTEFSILTALARNAGRVMSAGEIARSVHGYPYSEAEAQGFIKTYVARIRRKLDDDANAPRYIVNLRGVGYMLERRFPGEEEQAGAPAITQASRQFPA